MGAWIARVLRSTKIVFKGRPFCCTVCIFLNDVFPNVCVPDDNVPIKRPS